MNTRLSRLLRTVILPAGLILSAACAINPVTGDRELALVSESQELAMGREAAAQARSSFGLVELQNLQDYVANLGMQLARASERPDLPWSFEVVDDPVPNAFALPGGYIFVTRGLMALLNSEAELAAVLGHEIGHVTARHSVNQISRAQLAQLGLGVGAIAAPETFEEFGQLANSGLSLLFLKYGRDDERQADELGFRYMTEQGFDAREMADVFAALDAASQTSTQGATPSWLTSHPSGPDRIEAVRARVAALAPGQLGNRVGTEAYLGHLDGLTYGQDPRQGFFRDDHFYHPELEFGLMIPATWQRQNTAAAVIAVSPSNDAAMQLSMAQESSAAAAASAFLADAAVIELARTRQRINGHTAELADFRVSGNTSGSIRGIAAHIEYAEQVYRLVFYAKEPAFASSESTGRAIIRSFDRLTDPALLDATPLRIRLVELPRDMSLEEFAERYPSDISIEELIAINQVDGRGDQLSAGSQVKRVVR